MGRFIGLLVGIAVIFTAGLGAFLAPALFIGTTIGSATLAGTMIGLGISMTLSSTLSLLKGGPSITHNPATSQLTVRQPISYRRIIYGHVRLGGVLTYVSLSGTNNEFLHLVLTLAGHKVHSINTGTIYVDGKAVPLTFNAGAGVWQPSSGKYQQHMMLEFDNGDPANTSQPFPNLASSLPSQWTSSHLQRGCAKVHVRLAWDQSVYSNGMPQSIAFEIDGKEVFDPRTSTTGYSNNPALCLRDWLTDTRYGMAADPNTIDDATVIAAANICDESVALKTGGTQTRYTCDGAFDASEQRGDVINGILSSMAGICVPPGNKWRIYAGAWRTPVMEITDADLRGPIKMDTRVSRRDLANTIKGVFISPDNNWQPSDFPPYQDVAALADDGEYIATDIQLGFTTNGIRAQRLAKVRLKKIRNQISLILPCKLSAWMVQPGDTLEFTHDRFGFSAKTFEVLQASLVQDTATDDGIGLGVDLVLKEAASSDYDWTPATDEGELILPAAPTLPDIGTVVAPTGLTLSNVEVTRGDGIKQLQIQASWTSPADIHVLSGGKINVWIQAHTGRTWRLAGIADGSDTEFFIRGVVDGTAYDVKINAVNSAGAESDFDEVDNFTATATSSTFSGTVSSLDNVNDGTSYIRGTQAQATVTVSNSDFEQNGSILPPPGWMNSSLSLGVATFAYETSAPYAGSLSLKITATDRYSGVQATTKYLCAPGDSYKLSAAVTYISGGMQPRIMLWFGNASGFVGTILINLSLADSNWHSVTTTGVVPAGATFFLLVSDCEYITSASTTVWELDQVQVVRVHSLDDEVISGSVYKKLVTGSTGQNSLDNATFQAAAVSGSGDLVAEWYQLQAQGNLVATVLPAGSLTPKIGSQSLQINLSGSYSLGAGASILTIVAYRRLIPVAPGDSWTIRGWFNNNIASLPAGVTTSFQAYARLLYSDGSGDFNGTPVITHSVSDANWTQVTATGTLGTPVGKQLVNARIELAVQLTNTTGSPVTLTSSTMNARLSCNQLEFIRQSNLDNEVSDGATFGRPLLSRLSSGKPLIDFSEAIHLNKNIDNVGDGSRFIRAPYRQLALILDNPDFENSSTLSPAPDGWTLDGPSDPNWTISFDTSSQYAGNRSLRMVNTSGAQKALATQKSFPVSPGDTYKVSLAGKRNSGSDTMQGGLWWLDKNGGFVNLLSVSPTPDGTWHTASATGVVPANVVQAKFLLVANNGNDVEYDACFAVRLAGLDDEVLDGTTYRRPIAVNSSHLLGSAGTVPIGAKGFPRSSTSAILSSVAGSHIVNVASFSVQYGFGIVTYSSGSVNTGASFGQFMIYFSDPTYSGGAVTYQAVSTSSATNAATAYSQDGYQVIGVITTSAGGGGTGGGGLGDGCFSLNTKIKTQRGDVPFSELRTNEDYVLTARGTWKPIEYLTIRHYKGLMCDMGNGELSTLGHLTLLESDWKRMEVLGDALVEFDGTIHNIHLRCEPGDDGTAPDTEHSYTLANGRVVHNFNTY